MFGRSIARATVAAVAASVSTVACAGGAPVRTQPVADVTSTFSASADTYVNSGSRSANYGTSRELAAGSSPTLRSFLKITVTGLTAPITRAKLRLHVPKGAQNGSPSGGSVGKVSDTGWSETGLTYNNQPAIGATLATLGEVSANSWYELDVTPAIAGNGTYSFGLTSTSRDDARFDSRETGATGPKLVVTTNTSAAPSPPPSADSVLVGAGDISSCANNNDEAAAKLLDNIAGTVYTAGDAAYPDGSAANFANCYDPTWGRHKARTRPVPGNHEYRTANASGYFDYFGAAAGPRGKGYYSYDLGDWHVVGLNSNCSQVGGCHAGSAQEQWLRQDLAANPKPCTVAFWHHPLFTSGANHSPATGMRPLFQALYDHDAELVVTGHNHQYERFAPQNPAGGLDNARGIRAFVVGTGGAHLYGFGSVQANSQVRNADTHGVLKLTLKASGYEWNFIPVAGKTFTDTGSTSCH
jgi:acid phosphatase type 7